MTSVSVLVPYRGDDGGLRDRAWEFMQAWWRREYPPYEVIQATCQPGPWCKAEAVANALRRAPDGILVVADADVMCDGVGTAVEAVATGAARWAVPHLRVNRLTPASTLAVYAGDALPGQPRLPTRHNANHGQRTASSPEVELSFNGVVGGGLVVLPRALYDQVPLDPRFLGWGQEDMSWALALRIMAGEPFRNNAPLWHLWHPPQPRTPGLAHGVGSPEGQALHRRYQMAQTIEDMTALLQEIPPWLTR